jgi:cell filamentation protein
MSDGPGRGDPGDDGAGVGGGFDVPHLQAVHRRLFDGVDPDAGRLRTVDPPTAPGPGNPPDGQVVVMAVPARHIRTAGGKVLDVLDRAGLRGLATGTVAAVLAELYVDLRVLRPFQAGNDEAIRVFLGLLADDAGYRIDWAAVPPAVVTAACDTGDPDPLRVILQGAVHHIDTTGRKGGGRKRREVHALADTLREVADQLRPPTDPAPPG